MQWPQGNLRCERKRLPCFFPKSSANTGAGASLELKQLN